MDCICAEFFKFATPELSVMLARLLTDIGQGQCPLPDCWKSGKIVVLPKPAKDLRFPASYRPITIVSITYKLFTRILDERLKDVLSELCDSDQFGFSEGIGSDDILSITRALLCVSERYGLPSWIASMDCIKAFDCVCHAELWDALGELGVPSFYIELFRQMYAGNFAVVQADSTSSQFAIERGVRQGDPISPLLFNLASFVVFRRLHAQWRDRKFGIMLSPSYTRIFTLRYADDILVFAKNAVELRAMLQEIEAGFTSLGLKFDAGKCKVVVNMSNDDLDRSSEEFLVNGAAAEILPYGVCHCYLGTMIGFGPFAGAPGEFIFTMGDFRFHGMQWMRVEMSHRVKQAWASWHKFRIALTDPRIHLRLRLRAFESLISSVILYGCRTWSLTNDLKSQLDNVERSMLAKIMHCPAHMRRLAPDTSFVDRARLKRKLTVRALKSRHNARQPSSTHPQRGSICWVERVARAQWMWALRVAQKPESSLVSLAVQCYPHTVHPLGRRTCSLHYFSSHNWTSHPARCSCM